MENSSANKSEELAALKNALGGVNRRYVASNLLLDLEAIKLTLLCSAANYDWHTLCRTMLVSLDGIYNIPIQFYYDSLHQLSSEDKRSLILPVLNNPYDCMWTKGSVGKFLMDEMMSGYLRPLLEILHSSKKSLVTPIDIKNAYPGALNWDYISVLLCLAVWYDLYLIVDGKTSQIHISDCDSLSHIAKTMRSKNLISICTNLNNLQGLHVPNIVDNYVMLQ